MNNKKVKSTLPSVPQNIWGKIFHRKFLPENCKVNQGFSLIRILPNSNKGLSAIITTLILIALTISVIAIVWVVVSNLLTDRLDAAESCINIFNKVELNERYTCYNSTSLSFQFSINIGDIDLDEVIVSVSEAGSSTSYKITNVAQTILGLGPYPSGLGDVKLPGKNSGMTYISNEFSTIPDSVKITPVIDRNQCEVSDSVLEIYSC